MLNRLKDKLKGKSKKELRLIFLYENEIRILTGIGKIILTNGTEYLF